MIFPPPTFHAHPYFAILISVFTVIISCDSFSFNRDFCISEFYYILRFIKFNIQLFNSFHEKILLVLLGFDFYSSKYVRIKTLWVHKSKFSSLNPPHIDEQLLQVPFSEVLFAHYSSFLFLQYPFHTAYPVHLLSLHTD